jgi:hypothetical protein
MKSMSPVHYEPISIARGAVRFSNVWTDAEDDVIRSNRRLPARQLARLLPGRTEKAIAKRSRRLGVLKVWDHEEKATLFDNPNLTARQLQRLLPGRSIKSIQGQRIQMGIKPVTSMPKKPKRHLVQTGNALIDAIRSRANADGIPMMALDREIGSSRYFSSHCLAEKAKQRPPIMKHILAAVEFFGGELTINWKDE